MTYQPMPIVPFKTGLNIDDSAFLLPPDGFQSIINAHIKHNKIQKRQGYNLLATVSGGNPIMGLYYYIDSSNARELIAFTTTKASRLQSGSPPPTFSDLDGGGPIFSGTDEDYIWAVNWQSSGQDNRLYFTNGIPASGGLNGIKYYDGNGATTADLTPISIGGTRELRGAQLLFTLKQRLVVLNTTEFDGVTVNSHPQRARWCQAQGPSNWDDIIAGGGGFVDAPTGDHIISGRALQNVIIVFFTNSVWSLEPTSDPALPFRWKKLNDYRACDGKMGSAGYDRYVVAIGRRGITATDGIETRRIDDRIEAFVDNYINSDENKRLFCLRDYAEKKLWTLYPQQESEDSNGALIFDDDSASWSIYDIDLNVLGYSNNGFDWRCSDFVAPDYDWTCQDAGDLTCQDFYWQGNQDQFVGGDLEGNVFVLNEQNEDYGNEYTTEIVSANWNPFQQQGIDAQFGFIDILVTTHPLTKMQIEFFKDDDEDPYQTDTIDCLPDLSYLGTLTNITQANPAVVTAFDHGLSTGDVIYIYGVEGMRSINTGPFTVTKINDASFSINVNSSGYDAYLGQGMFFQREFYRTKAWKRAYAGGVGAYHSIRITSGGKDTPLEIHEWKPYFRPKGKRTLG